MKICTLNFRHSLLLILIYVALCPLGNARINPEKVTTEFHYAKNVRVENFTDYRLITIQNINRASKEQFHYALVPKIYRGALPTFPEGTLIVRTPVERVIVMTTTFIGFIDALAQHDAIIGVATPQFINNPRIHQRLTEGRIQSVQTGPSLDIESLLLLQPDLILTSSSGSASFDVHPQLARSGLPVVLSAGYMEADPLARSEWIKFIAAFFEADETAATVFNQIADRYTGLIQLTEKIEDRPTVFSGAPYSGAWHVPGGKSYMARAIHDAGGDYLWKNDNTAGGIPLDFERVFLKAGNADIWINPSSYQNMPQLLAADNRFAKFKAAKTGSVYNNSKQMNPEGGNNIWERGIVYPDEVIADMIKILHPQLMEDHTFIYYENLK